MEHKTLVNAGDYNGLMDVVNAIITKAYVDTKNRFITSGSGGEVLTSRSIGMAECFTATVVVHHV